MTEKLVEWFVVSLGGKLTKEMVVFIISLFPILELRGGLLAAGPAFLNVKESVAIPLCIVGNLLPIPFILWLICPIFAWLKGTKHFRPMVERMERKAMSKKDQIEQYEFWGLLLFVGIPLPGTGAWTGSLIAALIGMDKKKALGAIICGVLLAAVIMYLVSYVFIGGIFG